MRGTEIMRWVGGWVVVASIGVGLPPGLADQPPLIPREVLFGNPDKTHPLISPDGQRLAYLAPDEGIMNLWVRTIGKDDANVITQDRNRGIRWYSWTPNGQQLLYVQDKNGDENWHVLVVDLATEQVRDLTPFEGVQARVIAMEPAFPHEILVAVNNRDPAAHDVHKLDLRTGTMTLVVRNDEGFANWVADHELNVRGALRVGDNGGSALWVRDDSESAWRELKRWAAIDVLNSGPFGFTPDNAGLYILSSDASNAAELRRLDLATGAETVLASDPQYDVSHLLVHPTTGGIQAVGFTKERTEWHFLDPAVEEDFTALGQVRRGEVLVVNRDDADKTWLVAFNADDAPTAYYAYDRTSREARHLFSDRKMLERVRLARMEPIRFRARDGLTLHGYLTLPPGVEPRNLPLVLLVHGGPWKRDFWGFDSEVQWLANRGYAVLQVNFRGSTGYGKEYVNAGNREWGGKMQDDLIDGVQWVINRGLADPKRVAIFGDSYGGYAALMGLALTPDLFACGVDIVGPTNLITFMQTIPPYWKPVESVLFDRVGHPERDAAFLRGRSPLFHVDKIDRPLLIAQGANDPRIKTSESVQMVEALRAAGKEVEYYEYPDEGHGFARTENRLDFYAKTERFLATHLGGRAQP